MELLTESRAQTERRCAREGKLRYADGIVSASATAEPLRFGTLGHHSLEAWWKGSKEERIIDALSAITDHAAPESDPFEIVRVEELTRGYDARWSDDEYEVLGVELEFRAPLRNPDTGAASRSFVRAGKLDVLVRKGLRTYVMDHKFSGEDITAGSTFWKRLRMGGQASGYLRGAEALGYPADGFIYDVIAKVKLRPYQVGKTRKEAETVDEYRERVREDIAANPDKYYQRGEVVRLEAELLEHDRELWALSQTILANRREGIAPRNTDACTRYSSTCPYFAICSGEANENDSQFTRLEFKHPELTPQFRGTDERGVSHG
jgi:hypothetical protein